MNVLVADDHGIFREGLKRILQEETSIDSLGEADTAPALLELVTAGDWDVVVLDINMPGRSGLDVLKEIKTNYPRLPVLILSMYPEDQYAVRAMKAGAAGYLTKASASGELVKAIHTVTAGRKYVSPSVAEKLAEAIGRDSDERMHERLSDREFQVFRMIGRGLTVGEIAKEISLSVKTISTYRAKILEKMNMKNNADIMSYVVENNLKE